MSSRRPSPLEIASACRRHGVGSVMLAVANRLRGDHKALPQVGLADVPTEIDALYLEHQVDHLSRLRATVGAEH